MGYFQSVYLPEPDQTSDKPALHAYNLPTMPVIQMSDSDVLDKLSEINVSKASGPDNISGSLLKSYADILCVPLANLFRMALRSGTYPSQRKVANLVAIHKSGK